uniref:Disease resistance protein RPM1 n=1 Tax=Elaeis guineensis var. tenera TaxID=51953 RepID=A0A6J0PHK3_ELAGV|nr:disease resistance protein RPM1 [Elaeis guineensis]
MAEALVMSVIEKMGSDVIEEGLKLVCSQLFKAVSPWEEEVHSKIKLIKHEFELMVAYVRYVDTRKDVDKRWEAWVKILRDLVHQLEDIIDEYAYLVGEQHRHGFYDSLHRTFRHFKYIKSWRGIRRKLQDVEAILDDLSMQKARYGVQEGTTYTDDSTGRRQHGKEPPYAFDEDEIVGFETYKSLLVGWLTDEEPLRTIISVWGMGGLGKTTLVNDIYRSQEAVAPTTKGKESAVVQIWRCLEGRGQRFMEDP